MTTATVYKDANQLVNASAWTAVKKWVWGLVELGNTWFGIEVR